MRPLTLRHKLLLSQVVLVIIFVLASFPIVERTVRHLVFESLDLNTQDLVSYLQQSDSEQRMILRLKEQHAPLFYRITLYGSSGTVLFDAHLATEAKGDFSPYYPPSKDAVMKSLEKKGNFSFEESKLGNQKVLFCTNSFVFENKSYILRTAIAYRHVEILQNDINAWFITFSLITWLFFSGLTWLILYRLHRPIQYIVDAIKPYQSGNRDEMPEIIMSKHLAEDHDFKQLALTLNSLSSRVQEQIQVLKDERNEKEAVLESLEEGVLAVDHTGIIRYVNLTAAKMLGIEKGHLKGSYFESVFAQNDTPLFAKCSQLIAKCQEQSLTVRESLTLPSPKNTYLDIIAIPKTSVGGAIVVIQDTSVHHKVLEMGKDFIANASHELRTPITIILGFAETLQDLPNIAKPLLIDVTEKIIRNCQRMDNLVKNLLLLADIENMPPSRLRECDLVVLVENSIETAKTLHRNAQIKIKKNADTIFALADPDLLELAINNLLNNAAKYSKPPAQITIEILKEEKVVTIAVSDQGMGISAIDIEHIFERFYTVDKAHSRKLGGFGLGLSIVKTIVDKHGGTLTVHSKLSVGSTFTISLPRLF